MNKAFLFLSMLMFSGSLWAAACCGGGASLPNIITGDFKYQMSSTSSQSVTIGTVDTDSAAVFKDNPWKTSRQNLNLSFAYLWTDYLQTGFSVNVVKNISEGESYSALGDSQLQVAYEFLPELEYSVWKPRGYIFTALSVPTGNSYRDDTELIETTGDGTYSFQLGFAFSKIVRKYDFNFLTELHKRFDNDYGTETITYEPGFSTMLALGVSPEFNSNFHFGTSLSYHYEDGQTSNINSRFSNSYWWTLALSSSYSFKNNLSLLMSLSDQTLIGPVKNHEVQRAASIKLIKSVEL